ncbi:hypothetical protein DYBT9623_01556 [Dyadobacter sp. CECT 9623]|uniref:Lipoprotein n=1 Tax=Dyadobacter linearis TaxID=2823330 RepID=A0ABN7R6B8_9BACT|nr:hypothetical protein [Dyadobacter sp. CECT 9623]CAG5068824.1 hypothetical protein DYBT9623_01556 [Dyadobacter sp. CECT 9623]
MKKLKTTGALLGLALCLCFASCSKENDDTEGSEGSGSATQTTPNDSSGAESRKAMGIGEDNQDDSLGFPSNQSNLNSDSTRSKHDDKVPAEQKR